MGGFHSANFFFRHPEVFDGVISLSGLFSPRFFIGDYMDDLVYFNSPLNYLANMDDADYLQLYRQSEIIICVGQGAWEDEMRAEAGLLKRSSKAKTSPPGWIFGDTMSITIGPGGRSSSPILFPNYCRLYKIKSVLITDRLINCREVPAVSGYSWCFS